MKGSKSENVFLKSMLYFSAQKLKIETDDKALAIRVEKEFGLKLTETPLYDIIYLNTPKEDVLTYLKVKVHNNSMILLGNIHRNKNSTAIWEILAQDEMITVSLDMFYCGALFFRKEQVKEHFKIRI